MDLFLVIKLLSSPERSEVLRYQKQGVCSPANFLELGYWSSLIRFCPVDGSMAVRRECISSESAGRIGTKLGGLRETTNVTVYIEKYFGKFGVQGKN